MIVVKKYLSRRTMLRGLGASLALPFLDAMVPALTLQARTAAKPVRRVGFVEAWNRFGWPEACTPAGDGAVCR